MNVIKQADVEYGVPNSKSKESFVRSRPSAKTIVGNETSVPHP